MKDMYRKRILRTAVVSAALIIGITAFSSCSYEELTPKTDDLSSNYVIPQGEIPTAQELARVKAIKDEYNNSIK